MNSFFPFLDIIILGLLALFLGFRLKNLLGDRSGYGEDVNNLETNINVVIPVYLKEC